MKNLIWLITLFFVTGLLAQKKDFTIEDCELGYYKGLYPKKLQALQWMPDSKSYMYIQGDSIVFKNLKGKESFFALGKEGGRSYPTPNWLSMDELYFFQKNQVHGFNMKSKESNIRLTFPENAENQDYFETANLLAYTIDNNLYVANANNEKIEVFVSDDKNIVSGQAIHRFEFGISKGTFWSPNGNFLAFYQKDESDVADYPLLDITTTPGSLNSIKYPMAGQKSEYAKVGIYNTKTRATNFLNIDMREKDHFLTNLAWSSDEKYIVLAEINRDQNHVTVNLYDVISGNLVQKLFEEKNREWTEPEHPAHFIPGKNNEFLWLSERDGFMNLYHYNLQGELIAQISDFDFVIQSILGFSGDGKEVFVEATGPDGRENHAYKIDLATKTSVKLTQTAGSHHVELSPDGKYLLDTWSNWDTPRHVDLIDVKKGSATCIFTAKNPLSDYNLANVEYITLKSEDGFDLYGRLMKPHDFDPNKKYPVLVYVYGGPHAQLVTNDWLGGARLWMHYMTQQGYIVFTLDGRGSANRGYDFEKVIHRNLGRNEMEDQLVGVEYLKSQSYVDADRMAVHGWSFGGFMTTSLMLRHPGVFKVGVAGGPVIDWKWYEVMYGERYMDRPEQNPEGYKEASLLNYVNNLEGDLLMIHGTVDDVVVMQHNLAFVQACVTAGKQIDFFPYPMHQHNVYGKDRVHLMTKILNYIIEKNQ
ncbi:MAG: DPP IV N-terminal domain-containing protein [Flavobacteriales bacterium]|nr:DPP IV N-terminal domain-containing protein [Flavobacteriales bacterium]